MSDSANRSEAAELADDLREMVRRGWVQCNQCPARFGGATWGEVLS